MKSGNTVNGLHERGRLYIPQHWLLAWNVIGTLSTLAVIYLLLVGQGQRTPTLVVQPSNTSNDQKPAAEAEKPPLALDKARPNSTMERSTGWYTHPKDGDIGRLGKQSGSDKFTTHNYQYMYGKHFELTTGKPKVKKLLEIGLGCNMQYGPGHSAWLWRQVFPDAEIWFAEYDAKCTNAHKAALDELNVRVVTGDQQDGATLHRWVQETGGGFDVIIDDGGHSNNMIYNSFIVLFQHALKPGGLYIIEDLQCSRANLCRGNYPPLIRNGVEVSMIEVIKEWIEGMLDMRLLPQYPTLTYAPKHRMPPRIRSIECGPESCSFVKCYDDDVRCSYNGMEDPSMVNYGNPQGQVHSQAQATTNNFPRPTHKRFEGGQLKPTD